MASLPSVQSSKAPSQDRKAPSGGSAVDAWVAGLSQPRAEGEPEPKVKSWYTGQNLQSTGSGWDTEFMQKVVESGRQWEAEDQKAVDEGKVGLKGLFDTPGRSGVVTYQRGATDDQGRRLNRGDIVEDGIYRGNVFELYGEETGTLSLYELLEADPEAKRRAFSKGPQEIAKQLESLQARALTEEEQARTARQFQADVRKVDRDNWWDEALAVTTGVLGGAAIGFALGGPGGAIAGGVGGGIAAALNVDDLSSQAARAYVISRRAYDINASTAFFTGLQQMGQFAQQAGFQPVSNLYMGAYDAVKGTPGDGVGQFREDQANGELGLGWEALGFATLFADSMLQFATGKPSLSSLPRLGQQSYVVNMGAQVLGGAGAAISSKGQMFDYSSGSFESFTDSFGDAMLGVATIGIDALQLGFGAALTGMAGRTLKQGQVAPHDSSTLIGRLFRPSSRLRDGEVASQVLGANRLFLDDAGNVVRKQFTLQIVVPSELVKTSGWSSEARLRVLNSRFQAATQAGEKAAKVVYLDEFYKVARSMEAGSRKLPAALLNALAEGWEEAVQELTQAGALDNPIEAGDVGRSFFAGAAAGAGMSLGAGLRAVSGLSRDMMEEYARASLREAGLAPRGMNLDDLSQYSDDELWMLSAMAEQIMGGAQNVMRAEAQRRSLAETATDSELVVYDTRRQKEIEAQRSRERSSNPNRSYYLSADSTVHSYTADGEIYGGFNAMSASMSAQTLQELLAERLRVENDRANAVVQELAGLLPETPTGDWRALDEAASASTDERVQELSGQLNDYRGLLSYLSRLHQMATEVAEADFDSPEYQEAFVRLNQTLAQMRWRRLRQKDFEDREPNRQAPVTQDPIAQDAASFVFLRHPQAEESSYASVGIRVDDGMTRDGVIGAIRLPPQHLQAIGGDHDGDRVQRMLTEQFGNDIRARHRAMQQWVDVMNTPGEVQVGQTKLEADLLSSLIPMMMASKGHSEREALRITKEIGNIAYTWLARDIRALPDDELSPAARGELLRRIDQLVLGFISELRQGSDLAVSAPSKFLRQLNVLYGNVTNRAFTASGFPFFGEFSAMVVGKLSELQQIHARMENPAPKVRMEKPTTPPKPTTNARARETARASTYLSTLAHMFATNDALRSYMEAATSPATQATANSGEAHRNDDPVFREIHDVFLEIQRGVMDAKAELAVQVNDIPRRVIAAVERMLGDITRLGGDQMLAYGLALNTEVPDVYYRNGEMMVGPHPISVLQLLIRHQVNTLRERFSAQLENDDVLRGRLAYFEDLTHNTARSKTGDQGTTHDTTKYGEAFVAILGHRTLGELGGYSGPYSDLPLRKVVHMLSRLKGDDRRLMLDELRRAEANLPRSRKTNGPYPLVEILQAAREGTLTGARAMIDLVEAAANAWLRVDSDGVTRGRLAEQTQGARDGFETFHRFLHAQIQTMRATTTEADVRAAVGVTDTSVEITPGMQVRALLSDNKVWLDRVLATVPGPLVESLFPLVNGQRRPMMWLYDALAMVDPREAEAAFIKGLWQAQLDIAQVQARNDMVDEGSERSKSSLYERLQSRYLRHLVSIPSEQQLLLADRIENARTVEEIEQILNDPTVIPTRPGEIAWSVWADHAVLMRSDVIDDSYETSFISKSQMAWRELGSYLADGQQALKLRVEALAREKEARLVNDLLEFAQAYEAGTATTDQMRDPRFQTFLHLAEMAGRKGQMLGPSVMLGHIAGSVVGAARNATTKGMPRHHLKVLGDIELALDQPMYAVALRRAMGALTAYSFADMASNPNMLMSMEFRATDNEGRPIEHEPLRLTEIAEWLANPNTRGVMLLVLGGVMLDTVGDNQMGLFSPIGDSLSALLENGNPLQKLAEEANGDKNKLTDAAHLLGLVDEQMRRNNQPAYQVKKRITEVAVAHSTTQRTSLVLGEVQGLAGRLMLDYADLLRKLGHIVAAAREQALLGRPEAEAEAREMIESVRVALVNILRTSTDPSRPLLPEGPVAADVQKALRDIIEADTEERFSEDLLLATRMEQDARWALADLKTRNAPAEQIQQAEAELEAARANIDSVNAAKSSMLMLLDAHKSGVSAQYYAEHLLIPKGDEGRTPQQEANIHKIIGALKDVSIPLIRARSLKLGKMDAWHAIGKYLRVAKKPYVPGELTNAEWRAIGEALATHLVQVSSDYGLPDSPMVPLTLDDAKYFDDAYGYLFDVFNYDDPMVQAAADVVANDLRSRSADTITDVDLIQFGHQALVSRSMIGHHTPLTTLLTLDARDFDFSAASEAGTAAAGVTTHQMHPLSEASLPDLAPPDENYLTSFKLAWRDLYALPETVVVGQDRGGNSVSATLAQFTGRFASGVHIEVTDADGNPVPYVDSNGEQSDLVPLFDVDPVLGRPAGGDPNSPYKGITLGEIDLALRRYVSTHPHLRVGDIHIEMFLPDHRPPGMVNSLWHDGMSEGVYTDGITRSPIGALFFGTGGVVQIEMQRALDAVKNRSAAYLVNNLPKQPVGKDNISTMLETDPKLLWRLYAEALHDVHRKGDEDDPGYTGAWTFNAMHKLMGLSLWVKYTEQTDDGPVRRIRSLAEWVADPRDSVERAAMQPQLYVPSLPVLNSMLGDAGPTASPAFAGLRPADTEGGRRQPKWTGTNDADPVIAQVTENAFKPTTLDKTNAFAGMRSPRIRRIAADRNPVRFTSFENKLGPLRINKARGIQSRQVEVQRWEESFQGPSQRLAEELVGKLLAGRAIATSINGQMMVTPTNQLSMHSASVVAEIAKHIDISDGKRIALLVKPAPGETRTADPKVGEILADELNNGPSDRPDSILMDDVVALDVSEYTASQRQTDLDGAIQILTHDLRRLADLGATVFLFDSGGGASMMGVASEVMQSMSFYRPVGESYRIFAIEDTSASSLSPDERAYASNLYAAELQSPRFRQLTLATDSFNEEGVTEIFASLASDPDVALTINHDRATGFANSSVPRGVEASISVRKFREALAVDRDRIVAHLAKVSKASVDEITLMLDRFDQRIDGRPDRPGILLAGDSYGTGDMLLENHPEGFYLHREGHKPLLATTEQREAWVKEFGADTPIIYIDPATLAPNTTSYDGRVSQSPYGPLSTGSAILMEVPLSRFDSKHLEGHGIRKSTHVNDQHDRNPGPMSAENDRQPIGIAPLSEQIKKQSAVVDSFRKSINVFGLNMNELLLRSFGPLLGTDNLVTIKTWLSNLHKSEVHLDREEAHQLATRGLVGATEPMRIALGPALAEFPGLNSVLQQVDSVESAVVRGVLATLLHHGSLQVLANHASLLSAEMSDPGAETRKPEGTLALAFETSDAFRRYYTDYVNGQFLRQPNGSSRYEYDAFTHQVTAWPVNGGPPYTGWLIDQMDLLTDDNTAKAAQSYNPRERSGSSPYYDDMGDMMLGEGFTAEFSTATYDAAYKEDSIFTIPNWEEIKDSPAELRNLYEQLWSRRTIEESLSESEIQELDRDWVLLPREYEYAEKATDTVPSVYTLLNTDPEFGWDEKAEADLERKIGEVLRALNLTPNEKNILMVHAWVRRWVGSPAPMKGEKEDPSRMFPDQVLGSKNRRGHLDQILANINNGLSPLWGAEINWLSVYELREIFQAQPKAQNPWLPKMRTELPDGADVSGTRYDFGGQAPRIDMHDWDQWVVWSLGSSTGSTKPGAGGPFQLIKDGLRLSYMSLRNRTIGMGVSDDTLIQGLLMDPENNRPLVSSDAGVNASLAQTTVLDAPTAALSDYYQDVGILPDPWDEEGENNQARARRHVSAWTREASGVSRQQSAADIARNGQVSRRTAAGMNGFIKGANNLRYLTTIANPAIYVAAIPERISHSTIEYVASSLDGSGTGALNRAFSNLAEAAREDNASAMEQLAGQVIENLGLEPILSLDEMNLLNSFAKELGKMSGFNQMQNEEIRYHRPVEQGQGIVGRKLEQAASWAGRTFNDPGKGMSRKQDARQYLIRSWALLAADPLSHNLTFTEYVRRMRATDGLWLKEAMPNIHEKAENSTMTFRSLKQSTFGALLKSVWSPMANSDRPSVSTVGNGLKGLFMFGNFWASIGTFITGTEGIDQLIGQQLAGRSSKFKGKVVRHIKGQANAEFADDVFDMSDVLEAVDLTHVFVRNGVTHSMLFAYLLSGGLGLAGDDEEAKRRRKLMMHTGHTYIIDPREVEHDFRARDGIFIDFLGPFAGLWRAVGLPEGSETLVQMPWIAKAFLSPLIGMERFMMTGDVHQIVWGFEDAIGAFPLVNANMWSQAVQTFKELTVAADTAMADGTQAGLVQGRNLLFSAVMSLESAYLESSFLNALYTASDPRDRDSWALPQLDDQGNRVIDPTTGAPAQSRNLQEFVDDDGIVRKGWQNRTPNDARLRAYTENRFGLALMDSLFTGFRGKGFLLNSEAWRQNMVVNQPTIQREEWSDEDVQALLLAQFMTSGGAPKYTEAEAEAIVRQGLYESDGVYYGDDVVHPLALSMLDELTGNEVPTVSGSRYLLESIEKGSFDINQIHESGFFITPEQRVEIEDKWTEDLVAEGIALGLDQSRAVSRAKRIWYGDSFTGTPALRELVWSDAIPYSGTLRYNQLNTTWVTGPDGKPWATGFKRSSWLSALGLGFLAQYGSDEMNLKLDERYNAVDDVAGINTGLRALERVAEPPLEKPKTDPFEKYGTFQNNTSGGSRGSGYGGGYGGRGGGGGSRAYYTRLYALSGGRNPYGMTVPIIRINDPYIRRANISRQRITSNRGRLNQWQ